MTNGRNLKLYYLRNYTLDQMLSTAIDTAISSRRWVYSVGYFEGKTIISCREPSSHTLNLTQIRAADYSQQSGLSIQTSLKHLATLAEAGLVSERLLHSNTRVFRLREQDATQVGIEIIKSLRDDGGIFDDERIDQIEVSAPSDHNVNYDKIHIVYLTQGINMKPNLSSRMMAIAGISAIAAALSGCGGGSQTATNTIAPSGTISAIGGSTLSFTASAQSPQGQITGAWSIIQSAGDLSVPLPVLSNPSCTTASVNYQANSTSSSSLSCITSVQLPPLKTKASWVLANTASSSSGVKTDTVTINGTPTAPGGSSSVQIINTDTSKQVYAGDTLNLTCTAAGGQYINSKSPKVSWSYGSLNVNGQNVTINPAETLTVNADNSVTDSLAIVAPVSLYTPTTMVFTCSASDDISTVTKNFTVSFVAALASPFNIIGGQVISGIAGSQVSITPTVNDPTGKVTNANVYTRWSQVSGPSAIIPVGGFVYGLPFNFTAPANTGTTAQTFVFKVDASSTPLNDQSTVPNGQSSQVTYMNYPNTNGGVIVSAGNSQAVVAGSVVTLNGSAQANNGSVITGQTWSVTAAPNGSTATISNANSLTGAQFIPNLTGSYTILLTVNAVDNTGNQVVRTAQTQVVAN